MINITTGKRQFHNGVVKTQIAFERRFASLTKPIFKKQLKRIVDSVSNSDLNFNLIVFEDQQKLIKLFTDQYRSVGDYWNNDVSKRISGQKSVKGIYTKDASGIFEQSYEQWLTEFAFVRVVQDINPSTLSMARKLVDKGIRDGESYQQIARNITKMEPTISSFRARRIAATETHTALTKTVEDTIQAHGLQTTKDWNAFLDDRVRDTHAAANNQRVPTKEKFIVGGEELKYPGDPNGSAKNIIFCRCIALYNNSI